ncbi:hypothetical protein QQ045_008469 [Rhodiola kirilowii]
MWMCGISKKQFAEKASDKGKRLSSDDDLEKEVRMLKIMSYNVWYRADLEVQARMRAIVNLIKLHSPDIICVTGLKGWNEVGRGCRKKLPNTKYAEYIA